MPGPRLVAVLVERTAPSPNSKPRRLPWTRPGERGQGTDAQDLLSAAQVPPLPAHHHHPDQIRRPGSDLVTKPASH